MNGAGSPAPRGAIQRLLQGPRIVFAAAPTWSAVNIAASATSGLLPLVGLYLTKLLVDVVAVGDPGAQLQALWIAGGIAASLFLVALTRALTGLAGEAVSDRAADRVLTRLHAKSNELDLEFYERSDFHESLHRAQREAPFRPAKLVSGLSDLSVAVVGGIGVLALLWTAHPLIPIALTLVAAPYFLVRSRFTGHLYRWSEETVEKERRALYLDRLMIDPDAAKEARIFGFGPSLSERFTTIRRAIRTERLGILKRRALAEAFLQILPALVLFACLGFLAAFTVAGSLTVGSFVMYTGALHRGQASAMGLSSALARLHEDVRFLDTLHTFLALEPKIHAVPPVIPVPTEIVDGWELRSVSFSYPGEEEVALKDVTFRVSPGEMVALVGTNGSGKTSLVKLLCRLYDPTSGELLLDGAPVRNMEPSAYRGLTASVFQDFMRFQMTMADNIWLGDTGSEFDPARASAAAQKAGAAGLLNKLANKETEPWDRTLGTWFEGSRDLSLGEWQKVALTRAIYRDAKLLILDEPTSSMDAEAEILVFRTLRALDKRRATVVVSHRFSTVSMADRICVLDGGQIVEEGSHGALIELRGHYARMFEAQAAAYREEATQRAVVPQP